jgi:hypothetical protein
MPVKRGVCSDREPLACAIFVNVPANLALNLQCCAVYNQSDWLVGHTALCATLRLCHAVKGRGIRRLQRANHISLAIDC